MLGLINFDALIGERDVFAILGIGFSRYRLKLEEDIDGDFGLGAVLRVGAGSAQNLSNNTYLFANFLFRYSLKEMGYRIYSNSAKATLNLSNLFSLSANIGVAF
ncbi:MAG: hypothetical protein ACTTIC_05160 [Helicobacteraceae bacterium]